MTSTLQKTLTMDTFGLLRLAQWHCRTSSAERLYINVKGIVKKDSIYFIIGIANSAPFAMVAGQRCIIDFCFV